MDTVLLSCEAVRRELSNYLEGDVTSELRARLEVHLSGCRQCTAVHDGMRNVVRLFSDAGVIELPAGFSARLRLRMMGAGLAH